MQEDFWPKIKCNPKDYIDTFFKYNMDALRICPDYPTYSLTHINNDLFKFNKTSDYLMNHAFSLWSKEYFLKYVDPNDNPWQNELVRTPIIAKTAHNIYLIKYEWYNPVVSKGVLTKKGIDMINHFTEE